MKLFRSLLWVACSVAVAVVYGYIFENSFGSPKEKLLTAQIENMKLQYTLIGRQLDNSMMELKSLSVSDDRRYRPILNLDTLPASYRQAGYGGVDRYRDLSGFINSPMLITYKSRIDEIKNLASVQKESFSYLIQQTGEWKREMDHQPRISPVSVDFKLGDGYKFREIHPVLGTPRMHYGQDFSVPYGTDVYATGDGVVIESGWNSGGFGNFVVIDHGYGLQTTYGHLSSIRVSKGMNVKRGDKIALSGNTGTSSGPHLHYEIRQFGEHRNPIEFFNNDMTAEEFNEMIQAFRSDSTFR
jgi:murein DD-endopeptidase MepM/ murein hydrolase activator NlpD